MSSRPITAVDHAERRRMGATIKQLRQMRGFKPDDFANKIGISRPYLANIEAARKPLTEVLLARIANVLDVDQIVIVREGYYEMADAS